MKEIINEGMTINTTARLPLAHGSWYINKPAGLAVHTSRSSLKERDFFGEPGELDRLADRLFLMRSQLWDLIAEETEVLAHRATEEAIRPFAHY
ncbi:hypothetical protein [Bradyrhizobium sp. 2S1]|uniref:hypothetical protein n=1 Tax=Bradyrhizobium sp. 2S1 TaxID=1404429 RepID=UPI001408E803|nr:hypothetical protein [Bradyrhizobium sp. 2S1]MCK7669860.1 hypothetical protein [Bradyrhizobium sp. 2S1]